MIPSFCAACGGKNLIPFTNEILAVDDKRSVSGLSGVRCGYPDCGEIYLNDADHQRFCDACDAAVLADRAASQKMLRRVRKNLKLTQRAAAKLTGGGPNAFSRYERGEVQPLPAVLNLFKLLDKHPELIAEIREGGSQAVA